MSKLCKKQMFREVTGGGKKRDKSVDIGKGLAMIAIVCGHISCCFFPSWLTSFWPVAFFFMVAGFYIKEENLCNPIKFIGHKLKTIYLPGTIIYLIAVLLHNPLCHLGAYPLGNVHPMTGKEFVLWDTKTYLVQMVKAIFAPSGELVMGAMWFLYALFFALCIFSLTAYFTKWIVKDKSKRIFLWTALLVVLSTTSIAMKVFGISIPRMSQAMTVTSFILCGMLMKQKLNIGYDNWMMLIVALVIYAQCVILPHPHPSFPTNTFPDIVLPMAMSVAGFYIIMFISKKIEKVTFLTRAISYVGRESLYIMALHIFGFFLCTKLIDAIGIGEELDMAGTLYTYNVEHNILLGLMYLAFGLFVPLASLQIFRFVKSRIVRK